MITFHSCTNCLLVLYNSFSFDSSGVFHCPTVPWTGSLWVCYKATILAFFFTSHLGLFSFCVRYFFFFGSFQDFGGMSISRFLRKDLLILRFLKIQLILIIHGFCIWEFAKITYNSLINACSAFVVIHRHAQSGKNLCC